MGERGKELRGRSSVEKERDQGKKHNNPGPRPLRVAWKTGLCNPKMALQQARAGLAAVHRAVDGLSSSGVDAARQALTLYRAKRRSLIRSFWLVLLVALLRRLNHAIKEQTPSGEDDASSQAKKSRTQVDLSFFSKLTRILAIVFPRETRIRDTALLGSHTALLVARTAISLYVAALDGRVVSALVRRAYIHICLKLT